jgi:CYTH domain-containing protein
MKYAHLESERRFLLAGVPDQSIARTLRITDRYVHGTRLRVRLVEEDGQDPVRKLGQKVPVDISTPSINAHTTLYLDEREHQLLSALPAATLRKTRHLLAGTAHWAVDVFSSGLVLAETEGETDPPFDYVREVTTDIRFSGGELAQVDGHGPVV